MPRLAAVHLPELRFGEFGHLKDSSQCCLTQSDSQESVNLQSVKSRNHNMIFSRSAQHSGSVTSWRLGDINFHIFLELHPFISSGGLKNPPKFPAVGILARLGRIFFGQKSFSSPSHPTEYSSLLTYGLNFYSLEFFFIFEERFKVNDFS